MRNPVFFLALWEGVKPKILLPQIFFQDQNRKMKSARCGLIRLQSAPSKLTNHFSILILTDLIRWQTSFSVIWESKYWFKAIHYLTFVIKEMFVFHTIPQGSFILSGSHLFEIWQTCFSWYGWQERQFINRKNVITRDGISQPGLCRGGVTGWSVFGL